MDQKDILQKLAKGELTTDEANSLLEKLNQERNKPGMYCKVSEKKAVSVYGIRVKFPVTFYADEWEKLLDFGDQIRDFIKEHADELKRR